ncbi:MAG: diacylglycerol kinase [Pirellulaceae bacterium]
MNENLPPSRRTWGRKFYDSGRGLWVAFTGQSSFAAHFAAACAVSAVAAWCRVSRVEWCLLVLCIAVVFTAELVNTALERLAKAVTREFNPHVRDALDVGSGVVLATSLGSAVAGCVILWPHLWRLWSGAG